MKLFFFDDYQLPTIGCFFLFLAMFSYWASLTFPTKNWLFQISQKFVLLANFLFVLTLASRWIGEGYFPLSNLYESLIFLSWGLSSIHLLLEWKIKSRLIGAISTPVIFFITGFSTLTLPIEMQKALPLVPSLQSNWLMMHVSMMMVSYATLLLGSLLSIFYLAFQFVVVKKNFSLSEKFPRKNDSNTLIFSNPNSNSSISQNSIESSKYSLLEIIDLWSYRIIGLGFPFLTIGIISGAVWANEAWGTYWSWDPKETWALITWLTFAIYLHSRLLKGWQGEKTAMIGSIGFFIIWICYLGVNFLGKGLHSYGWMIS